MKYNIIFGADHAGFSLKKHLKNVIQKWGWKAVDCGSYTYNSVDYVDFIKPVISQVLQNYNSIGVLICGSGIGFSIGANRYRGIKAALCYNKEFAKLAREHNDANILVLSARFISEDEAVECLRIFTTTPFIRGRHLQRINKIDSIL